MTIEYSKYQLDIFDWAEKDNSNGIVVSVAGSGKSFTLIELAKRVNTKNNVLVAFNSQIVKELESKLKGVDCTIKTFHSLGRSALVSSLGRNLNLDTDKYSGICTAIAKDWLFKSTLKKYSQFPESKRKSIYTSDVAYLLKRILLYGQNTMVDFAAAEDLRDMCTTGGQSVPAYYDFENLSKACVQAIEQIEELASRRIIDFPDMVYLPVKWRIPVKAVDWLLLDEAMDSNPLQIEMLANYVGPKTRFIAVLDPYQSIQGWNGADCNATSNIKRRFNCVDLPLSICYRCPKSHVKLAQHTCSYIEWHEDNIKGEIGIIDTKGLINNVIAGDVILGRTNKILVKMCIKLIANRIPAKVKNTDICKSLVDIIYKISEEKDFDFSKFDEFRISYSGKRCVDILAKSNSNQQLSIFLDKIEAIKVCFDHFMPKSIDALCDSISSIFTDSTAQVLLNSIHSYKGKQSERVFILNYNEFPYYGWCNTEDQKQQERNVEYVGITRSTDTLYLHNDYETLEELKSFEARIKNLVGEFGDCVNIC